MKNYNNLKNLIAILKASKSKPSGLTKYIACQTFSHSKTFKFSAFKLRRLKRLAKNQFAKS